MRGRKRRIARGPGAESPDHVSFKSLPPEGNVGRCKKCRRMLDACLIEISRRTPSEGVVVQRAYGCREHASDVAAELVHTLASWTYWGQTEEDVEIVKKVDPPPVVDNDDDE